MPQRRRATAWVIPAIGIALGVASCADIIGLNAFRDGICNPGSRQSCYGGPAGTEGVGICKAGTRTCDADGQAWGECKGEVGAAASEDCTNNVDDDCNGVVNDTCACIAGTMDPCYSGSADTEGKGICHSGTHTCNEDGTGYGACVGEQTPLTEDCSTALDDNCDGEVNEASAGCACVPGEVVTCYSGDPATVGKGNCHSGTQSCNPDGLGYGTCMGEVTPIVEDCSNATDEDCDGFACSQTLWAEQFGNSFDQRVLAIATNKTTGEIYIAGSTSDTIQFGTYNLIGAHSFLVKLDSVGTPMWARQFDAQSVVAVAVDVSGNIAIVANGDLGGGTNVMKLDPSGAPLWQKACGPAVNGQDGARDVAFDSQGDVVVAGYFGSSPHAITCSGVSLTAAGTTTRDIVVAKLAGTDGVPVWVKQFGGPGSEDASRVFVDSSDNIYVAGTYSQQFSFDVTATAYVHGNGSQVYVARLKPQGTADMVHQFSTANFTTVSSLAVDAVGNVILTGRYQGVLAGPSVTGITATSITGVDGYVAKFSTTGTGGWLKDVGATGALTLDSGGNVFLAATLQGSGSFGGAQLTSINGLPDVVVAKFAAADGSLVWNRQFGDGSEDVVNAVATGDRDQVVVGGYFRGTLVFDSTTLTSEATKAYIFVASIAP